MKKPISGNPNADLKPYGLKRSFRFLRPLSLAVLLGFLFALPSLGAPGQDLLLYSIEIPFQVGGAVKAILPDRSEQPLGTVLMLPEKSKWPAYTASKWGTPGTVAASAVNAIHLLVGIDRGRGRTMSLLPADTIAPAAGPGSSIVIEGKGGHGLFGGWAPPGGAPVTIVGPNGMENPFTGLELPREGDVLRIDVTRMSAPYMIEIENRPGGRVFSWSRSPMQTGIIARVLRPVRGVGRFEGTLYQSAGRLRANHPGVVDISTSPEGAIGGFQIIPFAHSKSSEMSGAWTMTQWLVIDSPDGKRSLAGQPPLFGGALVPGPSETERLWDIWSTYGRRPLVLCRIDGGPWSRLPEATGRQDNALEHITHFRIYFPVVEEPNLVVP